VRRTASEALCSSYVAAEEIKVILWRLKVWEDVEPSQTFLRPDSLSFKKLLHQNAKIGELPAIRPDPAIGYLGGKVEELYNIFTIQGNRCKRGRLV
jgi:hypothetical protein